MQDQVSVHFSVCSSNSFLSQPHATVPLKTLTVFNTITARNVLQSTAVLAVILQQSSGFAFGDYDILVHEEKGSLHVDPLCKLVSVPFFLLLFQILYCLWLTDLQLHKVCVSDLLGNFIQDHIKKR